MSRLLRQVRATIAAYDAEFGRGQFADELALALTIAAAIVIGADVLVAAALLMGAAT